MESYKFFSNYYDFLTQDVDYKTRSEYISGFFSRFGNGGSRVLDLACGTGSFSKIFSDNGYTVTGIDLSEDMLIVADSKCSGEVAFIKGDISDFAFNEKFDYCLCLLDSLNHLPDIEALKGCIKSVYDSLDEGGLFIFDVNTIYKHRCILADNAFVFDYDDFFLSWDNELSSDDSVRILLDFFVFNGENYDRYSEELVERAYEIDAIKALLCGFEVIGIYDDLTLNEPTDESERIFFICKRI